MAKNLDLRMEHGSITETLWNRVAQREDDREHGIRNLSLLSFKFNWLNENRVFGKDTTHTSCLPTIFPECGRAPVWPPRLYQ